MPDNPLWMFRPFLSPAPLPLEVISQLQEPMKALQMWLFFSLLLVGAIFDCQKRLIPNTLCALITMVGLLVFHPAQLMGPLAALPLLAAAAGNGGEPGGVAGLDLRLGLPGVGFGGVGLGLLDDSVRLRLLEPGGPGLGHDQAGGHQQRQKQ